MCGPAFESIGAPISSEGFLDGTAFQNRVWQALFDIPFGKSASYAEIASRIGAPKFLRAVASACGANPAAIAVPCHRVVHTGGALSGETITFDLPLGDKLMQVVYAPDKAKCGAVRGFIGVITEVMEVRRLRDQKS